MQNAETAKTTSDENFLQKVGMTVAIKSTRKQDGMKHVQPIEYHNYYSASLCDEHYLCNHLDHITPF